MHEVEIYKPDFLTSDLFRLIHAFAQREDARGVDNAFYAHDDQTIVIVIDAMPSGTDGVDVEWPALQDIIAGAPMMDGATLNGLLTDSARIRIADQIKEELDERSKRDYWSDGDAADYGRKEQG